MKNRLKEFLLLITVLVIGSFISAGSIMAQPTGVAYVKSKKLCYEFKAEDEKNKGEDCVESSSTWVIDFTESLDELQCSDMKVYVKYGPNVSCENARDGELIKDPVWVDELAVYNKKDAATGSKPKYLREIVAADTECGVIWLRFADKKNCENIRCYIRGDRAYCR